MNTSAGIDLGLPEVPGYDDPLAGVLMDDPLEPEPAIPHDQASPERSEEPIDGLRKEINGFGEHGGIF